MFTVGEFSKICQVTIKTLHYYDRIGLLQPSKVDKFTGYRYYNQTQLDKMLLMGTTRTEVRIISHKSEEIRDAILKELDRGVTMLEGESGYLHNRTQMIFSVISNRELPKVERIIRDIDPESFMVVSRVSEVKGRGFSLNKKYQ